VKLQCYLRQRLNLDAEQGVDIFHAGLVRLNAVGRRGDRLWNSHAAMDQFSATDPDDSIALVPRHNHRLNRCLFALSVGNVEFSGVINENTSASGVPILPTVKAASMALSYMGSPFTHSVGKLLISALRQWSCTIEVPSNLPANDAPR
jgi:hypothetical protein